MSRIQRLYTLLRSFFTYPVKIRRRSFRRGYYFTRFEGEPEAEILRAYIPSQIAIPLKQGFGREVPPLVKRGDVVKAGQIIGRDDAIVSSPINATVNGTVDEVKRVEYFGEKVRFVYITPDGSSDWQALEGYSAQWSELPASKIEELLYLSGVTALGSSGIPTRYNSSIIAPAEVKHIIVHHTEAEMFNASLPLLLKSDRLNHFVEGLLILKTVMKHAKIHLALSHPLTKWLYDIGDSLQDRDGFFYYIVKPKYPQHQPEILVSSILKKKISYGQLPANIGVLTFTIQDILHIYDAVASGKPLVEKLLVAAGPGFSPCQHFFVRIGTPVQAAINPFAKYDNLEYRYALHSRYILNSLITGKTITNLHYPVTKEYSKVIAVLEGREGEFFSFMWAGIRKDSHSNTFLSFFLPFLPFSPFKKRVTTNFGGKKRRCLSCGFCNECCPVGLYPNLLHRYVEREKFDESLVRYGIFDCVDCNLCTYVCPSKIPVAESIKFGKKKLVEEGFHPYEHESFVDLQEIDEYRGLP